MKNKLVYCLLAVLFVLSSAFTFHKFYVGVFQVNYAAEKKNATDYFPHFY
ncbi:hypothetical protein [Flavobacterium sp. CGRL2]